MIIQKLGFALRTLANVNLLACLSFVCPQFGHALDIAKCPKKLDPVHSPKRGKKVPDHELWASAEPILLQAEDGKLYAVSFSFDSELNNEDAIRAVYTNPAVVANLKKDRHFPRFPVERLVGQLGQSRTQFNSFILRKGVPQGLNKYSLLDLNPSFATKF